MKTPRPYQEAAITSCLKYLFEQKGNPLVVAPVGSGKSLMIAEVVKRLQGFYPDIKILMLSHVKELIEQNAAELLEQHPECDVGIYCAGLKRKDRRASVTYATIQSMANKLIHLSAPPQIIIVDECHLISHKDSTQYRKLIDEAMHLNPNCRVIGFTGTPFRADTGRLDEGDNKIFDAVCYEISMSYMIKEGYWAKPICPDVETRMDTSSVAIRGGDYVAKQLQETVDNPDLTLSCVDEMISLARNRKKWLVFTAGIHHAEEVCRILKESGIKAEYLTGDHDVKDRSIIIEKFRRGDIKCLVNVAVLTTGFNVPDIDMIAFMRPTRSPVLYIQMIGRGVRPVYAQGIDLSSKEGRFEAMAQSHKQDCMVLDFGNVVKELGPIDAVSIEKSYVEKEESDEKGEAIMKICPSCSYECAPAQRVCHNCGYQFLNIEKKAARETAVMSEDEKPKWLDVTEVYYEKHNKKGGHPSLKVSYATIDGFMREWICFEHHKYDAESPKRFAWNKAVRWHKARRPDDKPPTTVEAAIEMNYVNPSRVKVKRNGKFWEVIDYDFTVNENKTVDEEDYFDIPF